MTYTREDAKKLDQYGQVILKGLSVAVKILDVKTAYNRKRYLVTPVSGTGEIWVETVYSIKEGPANA